MQMITLHSPDTQDTPYEILRSRLMNGETLTATLEHRTQKGSLILVLKYQLRKVKTLFRLESSEAYYTYYSQSWVLLESSTDPDEILDIALTMTTISDWS